jgi:hypothetical protein
MEMPIQVIVTLFVALVVGAAIIGLAAQILNPDTLCDVPITGDYFCDRGDGGPDVGEECLVEREHVSNYEIGRLVYACYKQYHGRSVNLKEFCCRYIWKEGAFDSDDVVSGLLEPLNASHVDFDVDSGARWVTITYDSIDGEVEVKG